MQEETRQYKLTLQNTHPSTHIPVGARESKRKKESEEKFKPTKKIKPTENVNLYTHYPLRRNATISKRYSGSNCTGWREKKNPQPSQKKTNIQDRPGGFVFGSSGIVLSIQLIQPNANTKHNQSKYKVNYSGEKHLQRKYLTYLITSSNVKKQQNNLTKYQKQSKSAEGWETGAKRKCSGIIVQVQNKPKRSKNKTKNRG